MTEDTSANTQKWQEPYYDVTIDELKAITTSTRFKLVGIIVDSTSGSLTLDDGTSTIEVLYGRKFDPEGLAIGKQIRLFGYKMLTEDGVSKYYADLYQDFQDIDITQYRRLVELERQVEWGDPS